VQARVQHLKTGPIQLREHTATEKHAKRHQGGSHTTRLALRRTGNLSRGHVNTHKILKRRSGPTLNTTTRSGLTDRDLGNKSSYMECKRNCRENGGITNRTAEKEN